MKKIRTLIFFITLIPLFSFGQKINPLIFLNQTEESLVDVLKTYDLKYFSSKSDTLGKNYFITKVDESYDVIRTLNYRIQISDNLSSKLVFLCEKRKINSIRKRIGIGKTMQLFFPIALNFNSNTFYYTESEEGKLIRVEVNIHGSIPESPSMSIEYSLTAQERLQYIEILDPQTPKLPRSNKEVMSYVYGAWVAVLLKSENEEQIRQFRGELLATKEDTIILNNDGIQTRLNFDEVKFIGVYTHKNNPGKYVLFTGLAYIPNIIAAISMPEYASNFLALGIPVAIVGLINIIAEAGKKRPVKYYPGDIYNIEMLNMYARFPQGLPENLNIAQENDP
jgi:hypothetical protein